MGRGRKNNNTDRPWRQPQDGGYYGSYGGADFKLWKGAYQASPRDPKPSKPQTPAFPPYDASWQTSAALMEVQPAPKPPSSGGGLVYDVQHAINAARKLEQRLQKARSELLQRGRAWDSWVMNMRTAYAKEQERHVSAQRRLNSEIAEMEASVKEAYMKVQFVALHQSGTASSSQVPQPLEWESAMDIDSNLSHEQMQAEMHRMIQQAATMDGSSTPTRGTGVPPRTPVRVAPGDPSGFLAPDVPIDPYPTPPGFGATPGAQASLDIRTPAPPGLDATSAHGPTLAEKLSDKRRFAPFSPGSFWNPPPWAQQGGGGCQSCVPGSRSEPARRRQRGALSYISWLGSNGRMNTGSARQLPLLQWHGSLDMDRLVGQDCQGLAFLMGDPVQAPVRSMSG